MSLQPKINELVCATTNGNVGLSRCAFTPGVWDVPILIPANTVITAANLAILSTYLNARSIDATRATRFFGLQKAVDFQNQKVDAVNQERADGTSYQTRPAVPKFMLQFANGYCFHKQLTDFDARNGDYDVLFFETAKKRLYGTSALDATGQPGLSGFSMAKLQVPLWDFGGYSEEAKFWLAFELYFSEVQANVVVAELDFDVRDVMPGFQNVTFQNLTTYPGSTGVFTTGITSGCAGAANLVSVYGSAIAATALYRFTNTTTGATITITSIAVNALGTALTVTLDTTDGDYPASGYITMAQSSIAAWITANITYYEAPNTLQILRN